MQHARVTDLEQVSEIEVTPLTGNTILSKARNIGLSEKNAIICFTSFTYI
jgi:hypothetical protein